jgi:hypothetical protein
MAPRPFVVEWSALTSRRKNTVFLEQTFFFCVLRQQPQRLRRLKKNGDCQVRVTLRRSFNVQLSFADADAPLLADC